jgi:hypothetical protein
VAEVATKRTSSGSTAKASRTRRKSSAISAAAAPTNEWASSRTIHFSLPFDVSMMGPILGADQHVFDHSDVGDQQRRRIGAQPLPVNHLLRRPAAVGFLIRGWQIPVVEAVPELSAEGLRPGGELFALALDQCVQGIEHDRLHPFEGRAFRLRLGRQIAEDWKEEAFRFP